MEFGQGYLQEYRQEQVLSPAQMENLRILAMNRQELTDFLVNEQMENPMLEMDESSGDQPEGLVLGEWVRYRDSLEKEDRAVRNEEGYFREIPAAEERSLYEYLRQQIPAEADRADRELAEKLIGLLDERTGYFQVSREDICRAVGDEADTVISWIREMEPWGVGAFSLEDCLKLQLERQGVQDELLERIIDCYLQEVAQDHFSSISRALGISTEKTRHCVRIIRELNPRPAKCFGAETAVYVVPDARAVKEETWEVTLCGRGSGDIRLNEVYMGMASRTKDQQLLEYFESKIRRARQVIRAVEQREETLKGLLSFALERQESFALGKGKKAPLHMKEAAEALGIHPSTVSRAVRDKYVELPCGVVPIRELFPGAGVLKAQKPTKREEQEDLITEIQKIISAEDEKKPFSDQYISEKLQERGITAARRTVAKYREMAGIPGASGRRKKGL